jgi:hypothetical protein
VGHPWKLHDGWAGHPPRKKYEAIHGEIYDRIKAMNSHEFCFSVEKNANGKWEVIDQFRLSNLWAGRLKTKKAAQEWLEKQGYTEAPVCKWGYYCEMGYDTHIH